MSNVTDAEGFRLFWERYPRKVGKLAAEREWKKLHPPLDKVLATLEWQVETWGDVQFVPHPRTWIHQGRWLDEPDARQHARQVTKGYIAPVQQKNVQRIDETADEWMKRIGYK